MINPNDFVTVYRNGHLFSVGIASTLRGMNQDRITIRGIGGWYQTIEVDRTNGVTFEGERFVVKVVSELEWREIDKKLNDGWAANRLEQERIRQMEDERRTLLEGKAEEWYNSLSSEHKELADIWHWNHIPVAMA